VEEPRKPRSCAIVGVRAAFTSIKAARFDFVRCRVPTSRKCQCEERRKVGGGREDPKLSKSRSEDIEIVDPLRGWSLRVRAHSISKSRSFET